MLLSPPPPRPYTYNHYLSGSSVVIPHPCPYTYNYYPGYSSDVKLSVPLSPALPGISISHNDSVCVSARTLANVGVWVIVVCVYVCVCVCVSISVCVCMFV